MKKLDKITPWKENFAQWYVDVIKNGELMEYGPIKGTIIFKPNSYAIWENIQLELNNLFKTKGIQNVYLPMLIPEFFINIEKEHVEGFSHELVTVTQVGEKKLHDNLYIRPTSEVLFADLFKKSIESYKDLPLIYNQWTSVMRWEKTTNPFLRNTEFLWQEGHTVHANAMEARKLTRDMIKLYEKFLRKYLAIPTIMGKKTPKEKFAGACSTYTVEAMMKDGKALQSATSHYLAQNFSRAFKIAFKNKNNEDEFAYQTSWGVSTRLLGAIIMTHGDDSGIIMPPKIAPVQVDILELFSNKYPEVSEKVDELERWLSKKLRVRVDRSDAQPGFKAANSEIQGVPVRIEVGPKDLAENMVTVVRRDTFEKTRVNISKVREYVEELLIEIHENLYTQAKKRLENNTVIAYDYDSFKKAISENKFVITPFNGDEEEEERIKKETGATTRCIPFKYLKPKDDCTCITSGKLTKRFVLFAKAY
ncbi:proline--tRNA ligase [Mesomycoplasma lagogenitalium]|uniref:Proline--tRNA ligase n=1 Tax=Mesomycoplasma lagogenitalium TaxID=171286 RepID=A0ABY8LW96_9BACT|nr:proline--tRNA ligase [Mesomycoplasma lagogenitalium]WGI36823.1 proline--tRNA ligase [Mesomycoplasma lagogenitalium]